MVKGLSDLTRAGVHLGISAGTQGPHPGPLTGKGVTIALLRPSDRLIISYTPRVTQHGKALRTSMPGSSYAG